MPHHSRRSQGFGDENVRLIVAIDNIARHRALARIVIGEFWQFTKVDIVQMETANRRVPLIEYLTQFVQRFGIGGKSDIRHGDYVW